MLCKVFAQGSLGVAKPNGYHLVGFDVVVPRYRDIGCGDAPYKVHSIVMDGVNTGGTTFTTSCCL